jgi:MFS family permease
MAENRLDRHTVALLASVVCASSAALAMTTVLGKQVYDMTGHQLDLGLLGLAEFAPAALLVLVTGSIADRFDRRRVGAMAAVGEAASAGGLAWYAGTRPTSIAPIFMLVFLFGVARAFSAPSTRALPADMVPPSRMPWLIARYSGMWQTAIVIGPVMGGFLYAVDVRLPYIAAMVLLGLSAAALLSIRLDPRVTHSPAVVVSAPAMEAAVEPSLGHAEAAPVPERASIREAMEGLRFIRRHPLLLGAISLDLFAVLFGGAVALLPAIAKDRLGVGAVGLGWLRAAGGLGAGAMTIALAVRPLRHRVGRTLLMAVAAFGIFTVVLGVTRSFVVAFIAMAVLSGADAISVFVRATLVPLVTPTEKRGRVLAVENVFIGASNELGAFESGVAGQLLGTAGAVMLGGLATLAVAGSWWFLFPALRDVDGFPGNTE